MQPSAGTVVTAESFDAGLEEAQAVLAALGALRGPKHEAAAAALSDLIYRRGLERASEAVNRWAAVRG